MMLASSVRGKNCHEDGSRPLLAIAYGAYGEKVHTDYSQRLVPLLARGWSVAFCHVRGGGGFTVAAACNWEPSLFAGLILRVPFVDVLTTMCDASLPLTTHEADEWGDPVADPDAFLRLQRLCPYQNVKQQPYPPMFLTAVLDDDRVKYWQPLKYAAKVRQQSRSNADVVLWVEREGGHEASTPELEAAEIAFALRAVSETKQ
ncbi:hypothetical protein PTSG_09526 [Salpingoeca rosetta]|uniref:Prolyl endopeptidase-like n=1 Tax=Salpingoeca rosetta (strain ATCC 50818 / BSB-021) TaxID=946362 RepID=F2UL93_SALR5|nr:uncharacterized protein PTSG_09526 [Salpingoeca rosetta]EGD77892.1 hypothetical protein PTSG_09526 [Salpingoeca rosetta]|eukprot:XP_004989956.1 hypothetical protein PTSG_09526 [Salpingoeca rosetta]